MNRVEPLAAGETLSTGDEGEQVEELQRRLQHLGHYEGAIDGRYGEKTTTAVHEFQRASNQIEDGTIETESWEHLEREAATSGYGSADSADQHGGQALEVADGQLSDDGQWRWDGAEWQPTQGQAEAQSQTGDELSEDGKWRWDGTEWRPVQDQAEAPSEAGGELSEDGKWRWDGTEWQPVQEQAPDQAGAGTDAPSPAQEQAPAGGEQKPWTREINEDIDDPATEEAEPPALDDSAAQEAPVGNEASA